MNEKKYAHFAIIMIFVFSVVIFTNNLFIDICMYLIVLSNLVANSIVSGTMILVKSQYEKIQAKELLLTAFPDEISKKQIIYSILLHPSILVLLMIGGYHLVFYFWLIVSCQEWYINNEINKLHYDI